MTALANRSRRGTLTVLALLVMLAAISWWDVSSWKDVQQDRAVQQAPEEAIARANDAIPVLLSYGAQSYEHDADEALTFLTSEFQGEFRRLQNELILPAVRKKGLSTTASVERVAVIDQSKTSVTLLVFLEQVTQTKGNAEMGEPVVTRATVRMVREEERWLVDRLAPV